MSNIFTRILLFLIPVTVSAQTIKKAQPFGVIDVSDLEMKACEFEKDANAEVLFHKAIFTHDDNSNVDAEIHKRIKIFNENGKANADIRIGYIEGQFYGLKAQTINLVNGKVEITPVDSKDIYVEKIYGDRKVKVFSFPKVKPGSVVEFKYKIGYGYKRYPTWYFQSGLPTRYSEISALMISDIPFRLTSYTQRPLVVNTIDKSDFEIRALANIPSLKEEPYMTNLNDNCDRLSFDVSNQGRSGRQRYTIDSWQKAGEAFISAFGDRLNSKFSNENKIIEKAKQLKTNQEKIAYVFDEVKNSLTWNKIETRVPDDVNPWNEHIGTSAALNFTLCRILRKAKIKAYPLWVSSRKNPKVNISAPDVNQFTNLVTCVPIDSTRFYVLDATDKYNTYILMPESLLNTFGLLINDDTQEHEILFLEDTEVSKQVTIINAEIKQSGAMQGSAEINNYAYKRLQNIERYKKDGQEKFIQYLKSSASGLQISSLKIEGMENDTLPLIEKVDFVQNLPSTDSGYIYFNPVLLASIKTNPFLSTNRFTDIDFGSKYNYSIIGTYKVPEGYKISVLPASMNLAMPDRSITFKRMVVEQGGTVIIRYIIDYNKSLYFKEDYPLFYDFNKKMYEMLNEQVILKKS